MFWSEEKNESRKYIHAGVVGRNGVVGGGLWAVGGGRSKVETIRQVQGSSRPQFTAESALGRKLYMGVGEMLREVESCNGGSCERNVCGVDQQNRDVAGWMEPVKTPVKERRRMC